MHNIIFERLKVGGGEGRGGGGAGCRNLLKP